MQMTPINCHLAYAQWGIDLFESMSPASGGRKRVVVAVDYFTKWVEAESLAAITQ